MAAGLYIHVPFCLSKCPYCDFYSITAWDDSVLDVYTAQVIEEMKRHAACIDATADTLYFGGGTPSLLGGERIARLVRCAADVYGLDGAEITLEVNPADDLSEVFAAFSDAGGNRVSLGMQASSEAELTFLGRRHTVTQTERAVGDARRAGITNISLDMMLALRHQTAADIRHSAAACAAYGVTHVSAYLLKIEPHTPFGVHTPSLPDDDAAADLYLTACDALESVGYTQYEISNFSAEGYRSRHNLKYWNADPYLGIGPAAHSFTGGVRRYYPRSLTAFLQDPHTVEEDTSAITCGSPEEYAMLRLRLTDGLTERGFAARFGTPIPSAWRTRAVQFPSHLVRQDDEGIYLSREGFLVSDALIARLIG